MKNLSVKGLFLGLIVVLAAKLMVCLLAIFISQSMYISFPEESGDNIVEFSAFVVKFFASCASIIVSQYIIECLVIIAWLSVILGGYLSAKYANLAPYKNAAIFGVLCMAIFWQLAGYSLFEAGIICIPLAMLGAYSATKKYPPLTKTIDDGRYFYP